METSNLDMPARLAQERRARLAAERLLELKQSELFEANRKLGVHARKLGYEITQTRAKVARVSDENQRVKSELGVANQKIELVEGQLWTALQTIRDGFAMFDADGLLELANPAFLAIFDGIDNVGPGTSYVQILEVLAKEGIVNTEGETPADWTARIHGRWDQARIPDVTIRLWSGEFIKIQERRVPDGGIVTLATDITELMRMWSAVSEMPDGFALFDAEDRLLMCNDPYRVLFAESEPALVPGNTFEDILRFGLANEQYLDAIGREDAWLEDRLEQRMAVETEFEHALCADRWVRVYERSTSDGGRVGLVVDISRLKQTQAELERAMEQAEEASRAKSAFLANMSHEIRTPMNGVVGMAGLLAEEDLTEEQRLYAETIKSSGEALLVIINDILDYSKIEAEKLVLHPEPFDLERSIHEVILLLMPSAQAKSIEMIVDYDLFLPTRFVGDPGRVRQILTNLIGNAVKFTGSGHVAVRVVGVVGPSDTADIRVTVEDTGIGIPEDKIDHVFGEFNQVEDERNRKFEGTGLGLSITRRLVELMGGEVWVDSVAGQGSCFGFRLSLPMEEPHQPDVVRLPADITCALVVSDHSANRSLLSKQLGLLGAKTQFCDNGAHALTDLKNPPDIIIVEDSLTDMPVRKLARDLLAAGITAPIFVLSSEASALQTQGLPENVRKVLPKPVARRALFDALESATGPQSAPAPKSPAPGPAKEPAPARSLDVLLAEDNKTNQLVFRKMVQSLGLELRFADNGLEAVAAFEARRPDIIFMDISMPEMDGKEATARIREIEADGPQVPIIAVTAHAMDGDRANIIGAGLTDYLTKPLRKGALMEMVERYTPTDPPASAPPRPAAEEGPERQPA